MTVTPTYYEVPDVDPGDVINLPFTLLDEGYLQVTADGALVSDSAYSWTGAQQVTAGATFPANAAARFVRVTDAEIYATQPGSGYYDTAALNDNFDRAFSLLQEHRDLLAGMPSEELLEEAIAAAASTDWVNAPTATSAIFSLMAKDSTGALQELEVGLTPNVSSTGRFGMLDGDGIFIHENRSTVPGGTEKTGIALRTQSALTYTGGTPGDVLAVMWNQATVSAGVTDYVWAGLDILDNYADAGENVARYMQAKKRSTGPTWGFCVELQDFNDVTGGAVAGEVGLFGNGSVNLANRVGLDLVYRKRDAAGAVMGVGYGLRLNPIVGEALLSNGLYLTGNITNGINIAGSGTAGIRFETTAAYTLGINFALAAGLTTPMRFAAGQKTQLEATGTMTMGYEAAGKYTFENATVEKFAIDMTTGSLTIGSTLVLKARGTALPPDATDLASAITLLNTLKSRLSAAGAAEQPLFA